MLILSPGATTCLADLDCNHTVDAADLAILLGAWGLCDYCSIIGCPIALDGQEMAGASEQSSQSGSEVLNNPIWLAASAFGFASTDEFLAWVSALPEDQALAVAGVVESIIENAGGEQ